MKHLSIIAATLFLAACGTMQVHVSVLQPQVVEAEVDRLYQRDAVPLMMAMTPLTIEDDFEQLKKTHNEVLSEVAAGYVKMGFANDADALLKQIPSIMVRYTQERDVVKNLVAEIQKLASHPAQQVVLMRQFDLRRRNFLLMTNRGLSERVKAARQKTQLPELAKDKASEHASAGDHLLIGEGSITGQRVAYVVTQAEKERWSPIFDRSYGTGRLGKMEFAVKMETRGVFTIKGMSFDPGDVARMASKVTSQALMIASQMAGVPLKSGTFTGDGSALARSSVAFTAAQETAATAEASLGDRKDALFELAQQILARKETITTGTVEQLRDAMTAIEAKFTSTKTRLEAP